jgi:hypothetical protein
MQKPNVNREIIQQMTQLLDKTAVESLAPVTAATDSDSKNMEAMLINLKSVNARYDKHEAIEHVKALMEKYNIQIDEVLEQIHA